MDNNNLLVAVVLSVAILLGFHYFYEAPRAAALQQQHLMQKLTKEVKPETVITELPPRDREAVIKDSQRLPLHTAELQGSINLTGARLDDLSLAKYHNTVEPDSGNITLLSPMGTAAPNQPYYAEFGWLSNEAAVPDAKTLWHSDAAELTTAQPVTLTWDNGHGLQFERRISIDENFMFTVSDRVKNTSANAVTLYPFGLVARHGKPDTRDLFILYEGPLGVLNGTLEEHKYKDLMANPKSVTNSDGGWIGLTDKYWLVALVPAQDEKITASFTFERGANPDTSKGLFQTDYRGTPVTLAAGASTEHTTHMFAGAKRLRLLDHYEDQYQIPHFDRAIDFGWFYFLTKPFLYLLDFLGSNLGNFGLAILLFTIVLKLATLPLSLKSYRSMAKLKELQPEVTKLQERFKDDKMRQSAETMELYKREKVNPMSGCLPNLIQIPIFFALYKVLFVGIEMRQAPFFGWIRDLSDADPTSVLSLFGALPFSFIPQLGVWPLLMGISMFLQQKLSPQPPDKSQAQMFRFLPIVFTFMLAHQPSGLIIYWTWSNLIGIGQQWFIMHYGKKK